MMLRRVRWGVWVGVVVALGFSGLGTVSAADRVPVVGVSVELSQLGAPGGQVPESGDRQVPGELRGVDLADVPELPSEETPLDASVLAGPGERRPVEDVPELPAPGRVLDVRGPDGGGRPSEGMNRVEGESGGFVDGIRDPDPYVVAADLRGWEVATGSVELVAGGVSRPVGLLPVRVRADDGGGAAEVRAEVLGESVAGQLSPFGAAVVGRHVR